MSKFTASAESIDSALLLWDVKPTQTSIESVYETKVFPTTSFENEGPINFDIVPQQNGELVDIEIHTKWRVKNGTDVMASYAYCSFINNISNAFWSFVNVQIGEYGNLLQSMNLSYCYHTYFDMCFNHETTREDYLFNSELFKMDVGTSKNQSQNVHFFRTNVADELTPNTAAIARAELIAESKSVKMVSKLHCPILRHGKVLPTQCRIRVSLQKNRDSFLLMAAEDSNFKINIEDVFLKCKYLKPTDFIVKCQEDKLVRQPALYDIDYPEITTRSIPTGERLVTFNRLFLKKIPKIAFFCMQNSDDLPGRYAGNPFGFTPIRSFQIYVDNVQYFTEPLVMENHSDSRDMLMQLYKAIGKEYKGNCLINSKNFNINQIIAVPLTDDRTHMSHMNLKKYRDIRVEIDIGYNTPHPHTLIIYSLYDRLIQIDSQRNLTIVE